MFSSALIALTCWLRADWNKRTDMFDYGQLDLTVVNTSQVFKAKIQPWFVAPELMSWLRILNSDSTTSHSSNKPQSINRGLLQCLKTVYILPLKEKSVANLN